MPIIPKSDQYLEKANKIKQEIAKADWDESAHPRGEDGKFGPGGSRSGKTKPSGKSKPSSKTPAKSTSPKTSGNKEKAASYVEETLRQADADGDSFQEGERISDGMIVSDLLEHAHYDVGMNPNSEHAKAAVEALSQLDLDMPANEAMDLLNKPDKKTDNPIAAYNFADPKTKAMMEKPVQRSQTLDRLHEQGGGFGYLGHELRNTVMDNAVTEAAYADGLTNAHVFAWGDSREARHQMDQFTFLENKSDEGKFAAGAMRLWMKHREGLQSSSDKNYKAANKALQSETKKLVDGLNKK